MRFRSETVVDRIAETVGAWLDDPWNLPRWDRSVARIVPTSVRPGAVGFTFDTIAPSGVRQSYRITDHVPLRHTTISLVDSRLFRKAVWHLRYERLGRRTRVTCEVDLALRLPYLPLAIVLRLVQRKALARDLQALKDAIEGDSTG